MIIKYFPEIDSAIKEFDYKIFTKEFDEVVNANELCDSQELERLRLSLDQQVFSFQPLIAKIANRLQRKLLAEIPNIAEATDTENCYRFVVNTRGYR